VFANRGAAEGAIDELWHAGFGHKQIGMAAPGEPVHEAQTPIGFAEDRAATGAEVGAVTGGGVGALLGAAVVVLVPGIGPVLAGGLLTGLVVGAAAGAAVGSFLGPFIALGIAEDRAHAYDKELKAGRTLVVVQVNGRTPDAVNILRSHGPLSLDTEGKQAVA
jgi:hypothetical protein